MNGTILEQSQILTTHNLAILIDALGLRDRVADLAPELADRSFAWLARTLQQRRPTWRAQLQAVKNAAYAWRQALYFLSLCPPDTHAEALARLRTKAQAAGAGFQARFGPGRRAGARHRRRRVRRHRRAPDPGAGRRFLGWTSRPALDPHRGRIQQRPGAALPV